MGLSACNGGSGDDEFKEAVVVNDLKITSIDIDSRNHVVEVGVIERYTAIAQIDSGASTRVITNDVRWISSDSSIVSISASGVATTHADGMVEIRAEIADLSDSKDLTASSASLQSIEIKTSVDVNAIGICTHLNEFTADGFYENEAEARDITPIVTWTSSKEKIAEISMETDTEGNVSALLAGTSVLTAARHGQEATQEITVDGDSLTSIEVTPATDVIVFIGGDQQFTAMGAYTGVADPIDITQTVDWEVDSSGNLIISNNKADKGLAEGEAAGDATLVASCGADASVTPAVEAVQTSNTVSVTVKTPVTLTGIQINDGDETKAGDVGGSDIQLVAELIYSDNSTKVVTTDSETNWTVRNVNSGTGASVGNTQTTKGKVSYTAVGSTEIKVTYTDSNDETVSDTIDVDIN